MPGRPPGHVVGLALRCYPRRWRQRHGTEAAELAALLIADGVPARSVACSYLCAAARERLTPQPGHRLAAKNADNAAHLTVCPHLKRTLYWEQELDQRPETAKSR